MVRYQSFVAPLPLFGALAGLVVLARPVLGQVPLTPASVIGGSGSWNSELWNAGPFAAGQVADHPGVFSFRGIREPNQNSGDANGGFWLGKEGDEEEFFVLDLGQEYRVSGIWLFQTHNATFNDRSTNGFEIYGANAVQPIIDPDEPQAGGMDLVDAVLVASGNLERQVVADDPIEPQRVEVGWPGPCIRYMRFSTLGPPHDGRGTRQRSVGLNEINVLSHSAALRSGDADMDLDLDQYDLVQALQAGKYLTGEPATWGEGDWDGAPGGSPGNPTPGDAVFNQLDVIRALNGSAYLTGPYGAPPCGAAGVFRGIVPEPIEQGGVPGDDQTSIEYDFATGELAVDAPANRQLTSNNIDSAAGIFTGAPAQNLGGSFDNDSDTNIFAARFGSSFGSLSFGNVTTPRLSEEFLLNDLKVVGSLAGGGPLGRVDLVYNDCEFLRQVLVGADFSGRDLAGVCFVGANLEGADLRGANLQGASFRQATLTSADLSHTNLEGANVDSARLTGADLTGAVVKGASFPETTSRGFTQEQLYSTASYRAKDLAGIHLALNDLSGWNFAGQNLAGASFVRATLRNANLIGANLAGADFWGATLFNVNLSQANLVAVRFNHADLRHGVLTLANLQGANFSQATLNDANLSQANLAGAYFTAASVENANFSGANLVGADFWFATGTDANLSFGDLRGATNLNLDQADTRNAILPDGSIDGLDLEAAERLVVRDHEIGTVVITSMNLAETSTLELRFADAIWNSTIRLTPGVTPNLGGTVALHLSSTADIDAMVNATFSVFDWDRQLPPGERFDRVGSQPGVLWDTSELYTAGNVRLLEVAALLAGDANRDLMIDQQDLVQVLEAAKYLTGQSATWGEGDWNGAPGGWWGSPPAGDGLFDQLDIVAALAAGKYLTGRRAAVSPNGRRDDGQTSIVYDANTGEVAVDAPAGMELTSINLDSAAGIFAGNPAQNLGGSFDNDSDSNLFKATFGSSFGSLSFANVTKAGLAEQFVLGDLTVVGSLAGGGGLGDVDLVYVPVPEPAGAPLAIVGLVFLALSTGSNAKRERARSGPCGVVGR